MIPLDVPSVSAVNRRSHRPKIISLRRLIGRGKECPIRNIYEYVQVGKSQVLHALYLLPLWHLLVNIAVVCLFDFGLDTEQEGGLNYKAGGVVVPPEKVLGESQPAAKVQRNRVRAFFWIVSRNVISLTFLCAHLHRWRTLYYTGIFVYGFWAVSSVGSNGCDGAGLID